MFFSKPWRNSAGDNCWPAPLASRSTPVMRTGEGGRTCRGVPFGTLTRPWTEPKCTNPESVEDAPVSKELTGNPNWGT